MSLRGTFPDMDRI